MSEVCFETNDTSLSLPDLTVKRAIELIEQGQTLHATVAEGSFTLKIDAYLPVVCTAIHAGHRLRPELVKQCVLTPEERYFEEDPFTDAVIASQPITLCGNDSRFEYDLNRALALSTYFKSAWNKQVWRKPLTPKQRSVSHSKHGQFYQLYEAVITKLESMFGRVIVFDIHSYNHRRIERHSPVFNIGCEQIDIERWGAVVNRFCQNLNRLQLPNIDVDAKVNDVFAGRGYLIAHTNAHFDRTLVLPTEIKKVFMDESTGEAFPLVVEALQLGLKEVFSETSAFFERRYNRKRRTVKADMLSPQLDSKLVKLDSQLYELARQVDTLTYVNPRNLIAERKRFLSKPRRFEPDFKYKQLRINPSVLRQHLHQLSHEGIDDPALKQLYSQIRDSLMIKLDMLTHVGQESFVFGSQRYYGRPTQKEVNNARFLLHAAPLPSEEIDSPRLDAHEAAQWLRQQASKWQLACKVEASHQIAAKAMVISDSPKLLLNKHYRFSTQELGSLAEHELKVHIGTTLNARRQPLKMLRLGLPGATYTQEGLAILTEYRSGHMTLSRLKQLAARVIAVDMMVRQQGFADTFELLYSEFGLTEQDAFITTARVYRGGGFTKDHLYLKGFVHMLKLEQERSLDNLLVGKTGIDYLDLIDELVQRGWLQAPKVLNFTPPSRCPENESILKYLVESLRYSA